jgi:hypothetical protein
MNLSLSKHALLFLIFFATLSTAFGQTLKPIPASVINAKMRGVNFTSITPFVKSEITDDKAAEAALNAQFLTLNPLVVLAVVANNPEAISIQIPYNASFIKVDMIRATLETPDFAVQTSANLPSKGRIRTGVHFRGMIAGINNSLASFSFFPDGEVIGIASDPSQGNFVIGQLSATEKKTNYILYNDQNLQISNPTICHTAEKEDLKIDNSQTSAEVGGCVRLYMEADYELYINKQSVQATVNYMTGAFNQVATLYANDLINITLSQLFIWVTPDAYSTSNSNTALTQFQTLRTFYNGDLAHLTGIGGNNLGGIGYVDVLCFNSYGYSYSDINTTFSNVPTYSWTVEVMAHEIGHTMGSNHTHWCGWSGGAIDNCYTQEGTCPAGPAPTSSGTIMSYCHLSSVGINFANGFGAQPGALLRSRVSTSTCLAATCAPVGNCIAPTDLSVSSITSNGATVSWSSVSGANAYTLRYRSVGASTWNTIANVTSPQILSGLSANSNIEIAIASNCGALVSPYQNGLVFTTPNSSSCGIPTNLIAGATTTSTANISWSAVPGATSYQVSYKLTSATTWSTPLTITAPSVTISGLSASTTYNVQVNAVCGTVFSSFATVNTTTAAAPVPCNAPTSFSFSSITATQANVSFAATSGATSFLISIQPNGASTWGTSISIPSTSYTFTGLSASTTYNVRVQSVCANGNSTFLMSSFTTLAIPCAVPTDMLIHSIASNEGTCSFAAAAGVGSYLISIKPSGSTTWGNSISITNPSYWFSGLQPATSYDVRVQSVCASSNSAYLTGTFTTTAAPLPCGIPTNFAVNTITSSEGVCSFGSVSGATSYLISLQTAGATTWGPAVTLTGTTHTFTGLLASTIYNVRVQSVCSNGFSNFATASFTTSAIAPPPCVAPTNLITTLISTTSATSNFTASSSAVGYSIEIQPNGSTSWGNAIALTTNSYTFTGLTPSTTYNVRVQSVCASGNSTYATTTLTTASAPIPCAAPTNLMISNITANSALSSFAASAVASGYLISIQPNGSTTWGTAIALTSNSYTFTGLTPSTTYNVRLQGVCTSGTSTYTTATFTTTAAPIPCVAPTNLMISNITTNSALSSFAASAVASGYLISIQPNGSTIWGADIALTSNSYTFTGLTPSTTYNVRLQSVCTSGTSTYTTATFTTAAAPIPCVAPTNLMISSITTNSALSSFAASAVAGGYLISIQPSGSTTWGADIALTSNSYTFTGLTPSTTYNVRLQSVCTSGTSTYATATFTTTAAPIPCGLPTNLTTNTITSTSATSTFTAVTGASYYLISIKANTSTTWGSAINLTSTSYTFSGLLTSTAYNVRVQSVCPSGASTYATANFSTIAAATTCGVPVNLTTTSITSIGATSTFTAVTGATSYLISIKANTSTTWGMSTSMTTNSYTFSGLLPLTTYNVRVQSVCSNGTSAYANATFTTTAAPTNACNKPTTMTFASITSTSVIVNWPAMTSTGTYTLQYRRGTGSWTTISGITANSKQLTNLSPNRTYSVKIKTVCSASSSSSYTSNFTFQTPSAFGNNGENGDFEVQDLTADERNQEESMEENSLAEISLRPNPATTQVNVALSFESETEVKVELLSLLGTQIESETVFLKEGSVGFDLSKLSSGIYIIRISSKGGLNKTTRLVKQ